MRAKDIIQFMKSCGAKMDDLQTFEALSYFTFMVRAKRIIAIKDKGRPVLILAYSITDNYLPFKNKPTWLFREHNPHGRIFYVEKLVAKVWNRQLRLELEEKITSLYPKLEEAVWHRDSKQGDRKVSVQRRLKHAV